MYIIFSKTLKYYNLIHFYLNPHIISTLFRVTLNLNLLCNFTQLSKTKSAQESAVYLICYSAPQSNGANLNSHTVRLWSPPPPFPHWLFAIQQVLLKLCSSHFPHVNRIAQSSRLTYNTKTIITTNRRAKLKRII